MAIQPYNPEEEQKIIHDCVKAVININDLTERAYRFLYNAGGFIAHVNKLGFIEHYEEPGSLKKEIFEYQWDNQYFNFHPGMENYDYFRQKKENIQYGMRLSETRY